MAAILGASPLVLSPTVFNVRLSVTPPKSSPVVWLSTPKQSRSLQLGFSQLPNNPFRFDNFAPFAVPGEATETDGAVETTTTQEDPVEKGTIEEVEENGGIDKEDAIQSVVVASLKMYKDALANDDVSKIAEIESFLQSIEDEKNALTTKIAKLTEELTVERERILRISADFENFRKRTERERLSLMTNAQGEVVDSLLPVLDNFERAKAQIKVETEGEEKINNSYQSIYKQFVEILTSLGVEAVETVGKEFDPMLHEAIMREESDEFEEGIIIQEFRKGFKIGDRLLRPSMVKVSAGPGPVEPEDGDTSAVMESITELNQDVGDQESVDEGDN